MAEGITANKKSHTSLLPVVTFFRKSALLLEPVTTHYLYDGSGSAHSADEMLECLNRYCAYKIHRKVLQICKYWHPKATELVIFH